jgi:hypothetical protein
LGGPYFLVEDHDVVAFSSLREVEAFVEPYDAGSNRLFLSDIAEVSLTLTDEGSQTPIYRRQVVAREDVIGHDPTHLAEALRAYLVELSRRARPRSHTTSMSAQDLSAAELSKLVEEYLRLVDVRS